MRVLVAEDERITRTTLARQLEKLGHHAVVAEDGEEAWQKFLAGTFDIVLTDWEMPRRSGLELVRQIKGAAGRQFVYVIMLTSRSDNADLVCGIEAGADDYIAKPFNREELRVRLLAGERVVKLERQLSDQNEALRAADQRIRRDLDAAARVQRGMLPNRTLRTPHINTAWRYVPTDELAGDAIGIHQVDEQLVLAYVLDVSGHGVPAALLSVTAMHELSPLSGHGSDGSAAATPTTSRLPAALTAALNRRFSSGELDGRFLTMVLCALDAQTGRFTICSAGHPPPIVVRRGEIVTVDDAGGPPLAVLADAEYADATCALERGDRVYLYSDGIFEEMQANTHEQYGFDRLKRLLADGHGQPLETVVSAVVDSLSEWAGQRSFKDDVSILALEWLG